MVCFVPGCNSGNGGTRGNHLMKISRKATEETKQSWIKNIPKQVGRVFNFRSSTLCYKHFEDRFIIKDFKVMMGEIIVKVEPRQRWTLADDAVPTIFSNKVVPKYFDRKSNVRYSKKSINKKYNVKTEKVKVVADVLNVTNSSKDKEEVTKDTFQLLHDNANSIILPNLWMSIIEDDRIMFHKLAKDDRETLPTFHSERQVSIFRKETPTAVIRGRYNVDIRKQMESTSEVTALLIRIDAMQICNGIGNNFLTLDNAYRCGNVWISTSCSPIVSNPLTCPSCQHQKETLRKLAQSKQRRKSSSMHELKEKQMNYQRKNLSLSRSLRRIKTQLKTITASYKILQRQFANSDTTKLATAINEEPGIPPQMKMAINTAVTAAKSKSKYGMRYQADWILQCILLKICSPKAYRHLRENKVLPLPHPNYLTSLIRGLPCQFGFNNFVFESLKDEFKDKPKQDRQFILLFDEMKIREAVFYDKSSMRFTGYVDYGDFENDRTNTRTVKWEADHALVFMCRSLNSKLAQPIASFATRGSAPGNVLAKMIISCILKLEDVGCEIVGVISDGATNNKSAWKILGISGTTQEISNKITNPYDESRSVYFLCDMPHIIKCIRNNFQKSGNVNYMGQTANWGFYHALYDIDKTSDTRAAYKLTYQHINPNPFQKMAVYLATQIFSKSVADAIRFYRDEMKNPFLKNSETTELFTRKINDLFDACNASLPKHGVKKDSVAYNVIRDFLMNLNQHDTFASSVTMASIRVTLKSTLDLIDYLCDDIGFSYVLTVKFNQDCLENFFGLLRSYGGDDCHPTATSFSHLFRLLSIYMPTVKSLKGNAKMGEYSVVNYLDTLKTLKNAAVNKTKDEKADIEDTLLDKLIYEENVDLSLERHEKNDPLRCIVYNLCGFLVYKARAFTKCVSCLLSLEDFSPNTQDTALTKIKDLGHLKYPSRALHVLILDRVEIQIVEVLRNEKLRSSPGVLSLIVSGLSEINCAGVGCSPTHSLPLVIGLVNYYITLRMYFFSKNQNREHLGSNANTKRKMKEAKLS